MNEQWVHVGRLWTNGEPFLAVDTELRDLWRGHSDDHFDQVVALGWESAIIAIGSGRAAVVGADGVVRDDSWMEVFESSSGAFAVIQASGPDYPGVISAALTFPDCDDQDGGVIEVPSGELTVFSAAVDGTGPYSMDLIPGRAEGYRRDTDRRAASRTTASSSEPAASIGSKSAGTPH